MRLVRDSKSRCKGTLFSKSHKNLFPLQPKHNPGFRIYFTWKKMAMFGGPILMV